MTIFNMDGVYHQQIRSMLQSFKHKMVPGHNYAIEFSARIRSIPNDLDLQTLAVPLQFQLASAQLPTSSRNLKGRTDAALHISEENMLSWLTEPIDAVCQPGTSKKRSFAINDYRNVSFDRASVLRTAASQLTTFHHSTASNALSLNYQSQDQTDPFLAMTPEARRTDALILGLEAVLYPSTDGGDDDEGTNGLGILGRFLVVLERLR